MATLEIPVGDRITVGGGGWVRYQAIDVEPAVFVRFADREGRLVTTELYVAADSGGLDPEHVRRLPLGRIEAWANESDMAEGIRARLEDPGVDARTAMSYFASDFSVKTDHWVARMYRAQRKGSGEPQPRQRPLTEPLGSVVYEIPDAPIAKLNVPPARPYPDEFFKAVARVYSRLSAITRAPASIIADVNGVPVTSVHRWVKRARALGHLPPGQRGRAG